MGRDELGEGRRAQQRGVPRQDHEVTVLEVGALVEAGERDRGGVARPERLGLLDELDAQLRGASAWTAFTTSTER